MTEKELRTKVVEVAKSYYGCKESDGSHKQIIDTYNSASEGYKMTYSDAWCAAYVTTVGIKSELSDIILKECSCERMINLYQKCGRFIEDDSYIPTNGDIIFYDFDDSGSGDNTGRSDHVGIVVSVNGTTMKIIEGNMSDAVGYRTIQVNARYIRGYGIPDYKSKSTKTSNSINNTVSTGNMKYNKNNKPLVCMQTQSTCYKGTGKMTVKGILWHSTGANNPWLKRYIQPSDDAVDRDKWLELLGKNQYKNDWNHITRQAGLNCWIGKLADGTITTVQTMPWDYRPWGCGSGSKGSCNNGWIQFEICEDSLNDKDYFNKVYKEACEITAYLCDMYNLDPYGYQIVNGVKIPVILCHKDSGNLGFGSSSHVDVYHWFNKYGKNMDDVRNDVATLMKYINVTTTPSSSTTQEVSSSSVIKKNDVVKIASNATYYSGKSIPTWVKNKTWIVKNVIGDRAIIDKSSDGENSICSPINTKFLTVVTSSNNSTTTTTTFTPYKVRVTTDYLNIRKGAGTNYGTNDAIKNKGVYTIVDESSGKGATKWGLLKSYEKNRNGWISLDYTKRI